MNSNGTTNFSQQIREQLFNHLLPFWCGPALDHERGGWLAWLSNDLKPDRTKPKGLIVNTRILWAFSAVYRFQPEPLFQQMAHRAFAFVNDKFWDNEHGGAFWQLNDSGQVIDDAKKTYGQAFCLYALSEYYQAFATPAALARAIELFQLIEKHTHDSTHGGYFEVRRRDWSAANPGARLSEKDLNEPKSMNNHLHVMEAYTNLYRIWKNPLLALRLRELIHLFTNQILDPHTHHLHHFFNEHWKVRSDTYTFGHDIEASWLLCEAAEVLDDSVLLKEVRALALRIAATTLREGIAPDGALYYEGKAGRIIDPGKECWPQAEAIVGFLNAFQLSGDRNYFDAAWHVWKFMEQNIVDRVDGEWFWRINENGQPDTTLPKVSEWKGPYHGTRMCLETLRRLQMINRENL